MNEATVTHPLHTATSAACPTRERPRASSDPCASVAQATISIIIPALNEQAHLARTLSPLAERSGIEVIVIDGGSTDCTASIARSSGAIVVNSEPGRARQMNAGAGRAGGDILLFLHADTILPRDFDQHVQILLNRPGVVAGAFRLALDTDSRSLGFLKRLVNWRSRRLQLPYGDQALFMSADTFTRVGGYTDVPVMEDFILVRALRRLGRIALADAKAVTSARRWTRHGVVRVTFINQMIILGYLLGVSPERLARWRSRVR